MHSSLLNEHRHLLACLQLRQRGGVPDYLASLSVEAWETVYSRSARHAVASLLYGSLSNSGPSEWVPREIIERCRRAYMTALSRNVRLYYHLAKLLNRLNTERIPVIVLKGAHLAEKVYGNIALRAFGDVDLLFREHDLPRCREIIFSNDGRKTYSRLPVDIQWNIDQSSAALPIRVKEIWERSLRTDISGVETRVLCPDDLLLHLCLHLAFHHQYRFMGLRSLCDITEVIRCHGEAFNWNALTERAAAWRVGNCVNLTLSLCRDLLNARVPEHVMNALRPVDGDNVYNWAIGQILSDQEPSANLSPYFWQMWRTGHSLEKLRRLRHLIFPGTKFVTQKYAVSGSGAKNALYYAVRGRDHIGRYAKATAGMLRKDPNMIEEAKREIENITMMEWLSKK